MLNLDDVLEIGETEIKTKHPCQVIINKSEYKDFIVEYDDKYSVPGILDVYFPEIEDETQIITPYESVDLMKSDDFIEDRKYITLKYDKGETLVRQEYVNTEIGLSVITQMINGKLKYVKKPEALVSLLNIALPKSDLVHLELILSNTFRDSVTNEPCRLTGNYSNSIQVGVGKLALTDSWLSSLAFEHIDRGIRRALVLGQPAKMNPLEKVLNEEFAEL